MPNRTYYLFLLIGTGAALLSLLLLLTVPLKAAQASDGEGTDAWLPTVQLQEALADPSVATVDGALHVVGGLSPAGPTNIHFQWAPQQATWQSMPAMPVPRADAVTFVVNHRLYVLGGYNIWYGGAISYTHSYDPTSHQWFTETAMLTPTSGAAGALIDGSIYVFGGFDNVSESSAVQSYDPVQRRWTVHNSMPLARSETASAVLDDMVYIIGGNTFSATMGTHVLTGTQPISSTIVTVYDPARNTWHTAAPLPEPRVDATAVVRNGRIYVMGGTDQWIAGSVRSDVFIYDPQVDAWSIGPQLPDASGGLRGILIGNRIYAIGGYGDDGLPIANVNILERINSTIYLPAVNNK